MKNEVSSMIKSSITESNCFLSQKRWQISTLASIGFMIVFGIRCNFGAAKTRMLYNYTDHYGFNHVCCLKLSSHSSMIFIDK